MISAREIEYIIEVSKAKNITRAAEICNVSQPAMTMQINSIENKLGFKIFERKKGKIDLTIDGGRILEICNDIHQKFNEIKNIKNTTPKINIGIIPTISPYFLPKISPNLDKIKLNIFFHEIKTADLINKIQNGVIDYGILAHYKEVIPKNVKYLKLYEEELFFTSRKSDVINLQDAMDKMIILDDGNCFNISISEVCKRQKIKHSFAATSIEVVKAMILSNNGYGILPESSISNIESGYFHLQSLNPKAKREIGIAYMDDKYLKKIKEIIDLSIEKASTIDIV